MDVWSVGLTAPSGASTSQVSKDGYIFSYELDNTTIKNFVRNTKTVQQISGSIYQLIPRDRHVKSGIWTIHIMSERTVNGRYDLWLPISGIINENTRFLTPDPFITLTVPSATSRAVTVGAYNSNNDTIATFSGRGFYKRK